MWELKKQACSPKLAKKLKELGVEQESLWWWKDTSDGEGWSDVTKTIQSKK